MKECLSFGIDPYLLLEMATPEDVVSGLDHASSQVSMVALILVVELMAATVEPMQTYQIKPIASTRGFVVVED